jgi:transketolase
VIGGLGGAVAEHLSTGITVPLEMVGVRDEFGQSGGSSELMSRMGLTSEDIKNSVLKAISRKSC